MRIIIFLLLITIKYSRLQQLIPLFNCTFNDGLVEDCNFRPVIASVESLKIDVGQRLNGNATDPPDRPLSDATSVFSSTMGGEMCQFPYDINGWEMNFCLYEEDTSDYVCPTASGNQTCIKGQYGYTTTSVLTGYIAAYKSVTAIVTDSTDEEQCLSFYDYFTNSIRNSTIIFRMHPNSTNLTSENIVIVTPNDENKWYQSETSFRPITDEYFLAFVFYRPEDFNDTANFSFAVDDITVMSGSCSSSINDTAVTDSSISNETATVSVDLITYTIQKNTVFQTIESNNTVLQNSTTMVSTSKTTPMIPSVADNSTTFWPFATSQSTNTTITNINTTTTTSVYLQTFTPKSMNLALPLGLSLGLGIPALIIIVLILFYVIKPMLFGSEKTLVLPYASTD